MSSFLACCLKFKLKENENSTHETFKLENNYLDFVAGNMFQKFWDECQRFEAE